MTIRLTKHHGLGNDFLVALDPTVGLDTLADLATRWCDRRTGIGADGLLVGDTATLTMVLFNADGSRAEMSGNGIRCLAQAFATTLGSLDLQTIVTDSGERAVELFATDDPRTLLASVEMGLVSVIDEPTAWAALGADPGRPVSHLSLGNPHSVVPVDDLAGVDLAVLGAKVPDINLEIIAAGPTPDAVTMRVHERGAGITAACGTGACACAHAARQFGLAKPVDGKLVVHMDGGSATVGFHQDEPNRVTLTGPATFVATIDVPHA